MDINQKSKVIVEISDVTSNQRKKYVNNRISVDKIEAVVFTKRLLEKFLGAKVIHKVAKRSVADKSIDIRGQIRM